MRAWARLLALDLRRLTRSAGTAAAIVLLLVLGIYGAWRAGRNAEAARASLAAAETAYDDQLDFLLSVYPPTTDAGEVLYYLAFPAPQPPLAASSLARGRAAVETESLRIRLLALEGQLYEHETVNPRLAAAGYLDLAFLLIALLPLFIIAVSYDLISGEREGGTWNLVRLFAPRRRLLAAKLASRAMLVGAVAAVVMAAGALMAGIDLDGRAGWMFALVALHTVFWFALCLGVALGNRSSTANAMILAGIWVVLTILAPAALSLANAVLHPVPEALELTVQQRQGYHEAWDLPPSATMESFYRDYPEWSDQAVPEDVFTWGWYYAMNHRGTRPPAMPPGPTARCCASGMRGLAGGPCSRPRSRPSSRSIASPGPTSRPSSTTRTRCAGSTNASRTTSSRTSSPPRRSMRWPGTRCPASSRPRPRKARPGPASRPRSP